jgi:hypothetical protein
MGVGVGLASGVGRGARVAGGAISIGSTNIIRAHSTETTARAKMKRTPDARSQMPEDRGDDATLSK